MGGEDNGVAAVMDATGGRGAERVSVAAPSKPAQQAALEMAAKRARVVYFAGLPKHDPVSPLDMNQLHYKELAILGAYGATHRQYRITMDYLDPPPGRPGRGGDPPVPAGPDRRGVRDDPVGRRAEDGHRAVTGPYVIGCDVGSQGTNAALYGADGTLVASAYEAYDLSFPHPGWAEQDPDLWVGALQRAVPAPASTRPRGAVRRRGPVVRLPARRDGRVRRGRAGRCARR